ncbi:MAG: protein kinase [Candidatus Aminicenantes bacterium]|nr:protein kinase [Candidatus Aminicenantes bacterium]
MIGETVFHYKIIEKIAEGGMGVIYKARDTKLNRTVALKFLPLDITRDGNAKKRFIHEARSASILDHPNICTIYEINETEKGQMFIAMAFYEGETFKQKIEDDSLNLEQILDITIQICDGLNRAHEAGIVHRDIKPANLMITQRGEVKILDFGLAKLGGDTSLTRTGIAVGTAAYMSPEQASGETVDHRTDIWSLGVVLYEIMTKKLPFKGDSPRSMVYSIVRKDPSGFEDFKIKIPKKMIGIIEKCMSKRTRDRYQTISELRIDLVNFRDRMAMDKHTAKLRTAPSRHLFLYRFRKLLIPLLILCLLLGIVFFIPGANEIIKKWLGMDMIPTEKHLAVLPFSVDGDDPGVRVFGIGMARMITDKLILLEKFEKHFWVVSSRLLKNNKVKTGQDARKLFAVNLIIRGTLRRKINIIEFGIKLENPESEQQMKSEMLAGHITNLSIWQDGVTLKILDMLDIKVTSEIQSRLIAGGTALPGAFENYIKGLGYLVKNMKTQDLELAIDCFKKAIKQDPVYSLANAGLAEAYHRKYQLIRDPDWISRAESFCQAALRGNKRLRCAHMILGEIYLTQGQTKKAIDHIQEVLNHHQKDFYAYLKLAEIYDKEQNFKKVEEAYRNAIKSRPDYYSGYDFLGYFYYRNSRLTEAVKMYRKVIELAPENNIGYNNLGGIYYTIGKTDQALEMFENSCRIKADPDLISNLGTLYFFQGRYQDAVRMFEKAVRQNQNNYILMGNLADAYRLIPEYKEKSLAIYRQAIELAEKALIEKPESAEIYSILALYQARIKNRDQAGNLIEKALELAPNETEIIRRSIMVFELLKQRQKALNAVEEYVIRYGSLEDIRREPDLFDLQKDQRYKKWVEKKHP